MAERYSRVFSQKGVSSSFFGVKGYFSLLNKIFQVLVKEAGPIKEHTQKAFLALKLRKLTFEPKGPTRVPRKVLISIIC